MTHFCLLANIKQLLLLFVFVVLLLPNISFSQYNGLSRTDFERYISIFNQGDSDAYSEYYHPDVVMERGDLRLEGKEAILAFYRDFHSHAKQTIQVMDFLAEGSRIAVELQTTFEVHTDWSHPVAGEMKKGKRIVNSFVHYRLRDGKIIRIQSARFRAVNLQK